MKKLKSVMPVILLYLLFIPGSIKATNAPNQVALASAEKTVFTDADTQLSRLEEIHAMDLSKISPSEKKELRDEVLAIQNSQYERGRHSGYRERGNYGHHYGGRHHWFLPGLLIILILIVLA